MDVKWMDPEVLHIKPAPKSTHPHVAWYSLWTVFWIMSGLLMHAWHSQMVLNLFQYNLFYAALNEQEKLSDSLIWRK